MDEIFFTENHEWIRLEGDCAIVGITDYAQDEMGDITFVEVPNIGMIVDHGEYVCCVESTKTTIEVCAPIGGEITEVNAVLEEHPELINNDSLGEGWICKLGKISKDQLDELLSTSEYDDYTNRATRDKANAIPERVSLAEVNIRHTPDIEDEY